MVVRGRVPTLLPVAKVVRGLLDTPLPTGLTVVIAVVGEKLGSTRLREGGNLASKCRSRSSATYHISVRYILTKEGGDHTVLDFNPSVNSHKSVEISAKSLIRQTHIAHHQVPKVLNSQLSKSV